MKRAKEERLVSGGRESANRFYFRSQREFVYKKTPEAELSLIVDYPFDWRPTDRRPSIVFFFGGGFVGGTMEQFARHAVYLAGRGMVAVRADYRVAQTHGVTPEACMEDAKSAMRWLRGHAEELGIAVDRIVAAGGSAGGSLALATGVVEEYDSITDDRSVSPVPNALVLFNPAVGSTYESTLRERLADDALVDSILLVPRVRADLPPCYIWFGTADHLYPGGKELIDALRRLGVRTEVEEAEGAEHGYFNDYWEHFASSLASVDRFLESLGFLDGPPRIRV